MNHRFCFLAFGPVLAVGVMGCVSERGGERVDLERMPAAASAEPGVEATTARLEPMEQGAGEMASSTDATGSEIVVMPGGVLPPGEAVAVEGPGVESSVLDRGAWGKVVIRPADGRSSVNPHYMPPLPMGEDAVGVLEPNDPAWRMAEALRGAEAENGSADNWIDAFVRPVKTAATVGALPVLMIFEPPLKTVSSPPSDLEAYPLEP